MSGKTYDLRFLSQQKEESRAESLFGLIAEGPEDVVTPKTS